MLKKTILATAMASAIGFSVPTFALDLGPTQGNIHLNAPAVAWRVDKNFGAVKDELNAQNAQITNQGQQVAIIGQMVGNLDIMAHDNKQKIEANKTQIDKNTQDIASQGEHLQGLNDIVMSEQHKRVENTENIAANTATNIKQDAAIAANKTQIDKNTQDIASNYREMQNNFNAVNGRIDDLDKEMKKGFASQAALNGLFQPYNVGKFNLSVALGGYESEQAMALGTGYRFNENFAMKAGVATDIGGFDHLTYNIGANFEW